MTPQNNVNPPRGFGRWKQNYSVVFYVLFLIVLIRLFVEQLRRGYERESWNITEWLINYQGGFVRRGLAGEILFDLWKFARVSPYAVIIILCVGLYAGLVLFFYLSLRRRGHSTYLLPFTFFLGGPVIHDFWARKDTLMIALFAVIVYLTVKNKNTFLGLANLIFMLALMTHEAIGFFLFPVLFLILFQQRSKDKSTFLVAAAKVILKILPSLSVFFLVLYHSGTVTVAKRIWASWQTLRFPIQNDSVVNPPTSIDGLTWSLKKALGLGKHTLTNFADDIYGPLVWILIILMVYFVMENHDKTKDAKSEEVDQTGKLNIQVILLFQFITIIPLFILGWDYGRWIFLWTASSFAIYVLVPKQLASEMFPSPLKFMGTKLGSFCDRLFLASPQVVRLLPFLIGVPVYSWRLVAYLYSTPAYLVMLMISQLIRNGLLIFSLM